MVSSPASSGKRIAPLNRRDALVAEEHTPHPVVVCGSERHLLAGKSLSDEVGSALEAHLAVWPDTSDHIRGVIVDRREHFGIGTHTGSIAGGRNFQAERLMRSFMVVDLSPPIECLLHLCNGREPAVADQLGFQRSMKSLVF